jgi:hypothetical protein
VPLPDPFPGVVLHYSYLWHDQQQQGLVEGTKNRPCVVVLAVTQDDGDTIVTVVPITHAPPANAAEAIEMPAVTKHRLGLDDARSWVVVSEANRFPWPGYDLHPVPEKGIYRYDYGVLPPGFFRQVRDGFLSWARSRKLRVTPRE